MERGTPLLWVRISERLRRPVNAGKKRFITEGKNEL